MTPGASFKQVLHGSAVLSHATLADPDLGGSGGASPTDHKYIYTDHKYIYGPWGSERAILFFWIKR